MKILGISGSPRKDDRSGTNKLVRTVLEATALDYDLVSLRGKSIDGCIACLGCANDNICKVKDDMTDLRDKIVEADAYVIGAPNYYSTLNAKTHAFLERFFQFRHQEGNTLWGKLGVAVGVGGTIGNFPADDIEKFFDYNFIKTVAKVGGQGAASCFSCGHGETCHVGIPIMLLGEGIKITPDMIPDVTKQPDVIKAAEEAGKTLAALLTGGHDREKVTADMQAKMGGRKAEMMEKLQHSV
jgi:multimeric flavodoxin WrbA